MDKNNLFVTKAEAIPYRVFEGTTKSAQEILGFLYGQCTEKVCFECSFIVDNPLLVLYYRGERISVAKGAMVYYHAGKVKVLHPDRVRTVAGFIPETFFMRGL